MAAYYPGTRIRIRSIPPQDGQKRRGRWRKGRDFPNADETITEALDAFVDTRTGSDVTPDDRENMGPDSFPESDRDLEPVGNEFVTTDIDGEWVEYRDTRSQTERDLDDPASELRQIMSAMRPQ